MKISKGRTVTNETLRSMEKLKKIQKEAKNIAKGIEAIEYPVVPGLVVAGDTKPRIVALSEITKNVSVPFNVRDAVIESIGSFAFGFFKYKLTQTVFLSTDLEIIDVKGEYKVHVKGSVVVDDIDAFEPIAIGEEYTREKIQDVIGVSNGRFVPGRGAELAISNIDSRVLSIKDSSIVRWTDGDISIYAILNANKQLLSSQFGNIAPLAIFSDMLDETIEYNFNFNEEEVPMPYRYLAMALNSETFRVAKSFKSTLNGYAKQITDGTLSLTTLSSMGSILKKNFSICPTTVLDDIAGNYIMVQIPKKDAINKDVYSALSQSEYDKLVNGIEVPAGTFQLSTILRNCSKNSLTTVDIEILKECIKK